MALRRAESWDQVGGGEAKYFEDKIPKWDVISRALLPSLSRAILLGERMKTEFAATRTLVALRIHMLENDGRAPASLSEVAKGLPDGAFVDPFGEGPLQYRRTDNGFALYSVGPDHVNGGGKAGKKWEEGDMVWTYPPSPIEPFVSDDKKE